MPAIILRASWRCCLALFTLLLAVAGCGSSVTAPAGTSAPLTSPGSSVPFPVDRAVSFSQLTKAGDQADQHSTGAVAQSGALLLDAAPNTAEYAVYSFHPASAADHLDVTLDGAVTTAAWIGLADYPHQRWIFSGPFTASQILPLASLNTSPLGNIPIAILAARGSAKVDSLSLAVDNLAPVASITAVADNGNAPFNASFDAGASTDADGTIAAYDWDFDNDGVFETSTGTTAQASKSFAKANVYTVSVRVTDDKGATATASMVITVHGWAVVIVDFQHNVGDYSSLAVINGQPAISYYDILWGDLRYAHATTPTGGAATEWQNVRIDFGAGGTDVGFSSSVTEVNGRPAVAYLDSSASDLRYAIATVPAPTLESQWQKVLVDASGSTGYYPSLAVVQGSPAISYYLTDTQDLKYVRATSADGAAVSDWSTPLTVDSTGDVGTYSSLGVFGGNPAIAYRDNTNADLRYLRSTTPTGMDVADWTQLVTVDGNGDKGFMCKMANVNDHPAIAYFDNAVGSVLYAYSATLDGANAADWQTLTVIGSGNIVPGLATLGGQPFLMSATSAKNDHFLYYRQASTPDGLNPADWGAAQKVDGTAHLGNTNSVAEVAGKPAVSYYDSDNGYLKYAILF